MTTAPSPHASAATPAAVRPGPDAADSGRSSGACYPLRSLRLHLAEWTSVLLAPILLLATVVVVTVLVGWVIGLAIGFPLPPEAGEGFRTNNLGVFWALTGFYISSAALSMTRTFPTVLALGGTRRDYWLGSSAGFLVTSAVTALCALVLLVLETVTGGWFLGVHALDVVVLGDGDPLRTAVTVFLFALASLWMGAAFGTIYRAYGPSGVVLVVVGFALVVIGLVALAVWQWEATRQLVSATGAWLTALVLLVLALAGAIGSLLAIRRATF